MDQFRHRITGTLHFFIFNVLRVIKSFLFSFQIVMISAPEYAGDYFIFYFYSLETHDRNIKSRFKKRVVLNFNFHY